MTTLAEALQAAAAQGLTRLDAQLLLLHALGHAQPASQGRAWLLAHDGDALSPWAWHSFTQITARRAAGEPVAYLTGTKEFFGLPLHVDARVLVPRPETETLVEWALELLEAPGEPSPAVLDLGTGSGAIALALKHARSGAIVDAVDASASALAVARSNAQRLGLAVNFHHGAWFDALPACQRWHLIASNPPYVAEGDPHLAALAHEPRQALVAGADGLDGLRTIVAQAPGFLHPGGWLLLEHGWNQAAAVRALLAARGFARPDTRLDLAGIERCTSARWPAKE